MNKIIMAVVAIVIIAAAAIMMLPQVEPETPEGTQETGGQTTVDEEYIIDDFYVEMLEEEVDTVELEEFNMEMEDQMASDLSQFYYE